MPKTLYVTDLDGTLLRNDTTVSSHTAETINAFMAAGGLFTYATARSFSSAGKIMAPLNLTLPAITFNGTFIIDAQTGVWQQACIMDRKAALGAVEAILRTGLTPLVYASLGGRERVSWLPAKAGGGALDYVASRKDDKRLRAVEDVQALTEGEVYYITLIDTLQTVEAVHPVISRDASLHAHLLEDTYTPGQYWLEISRHDSGKGNALLRLKEMLGVDHVVCFGDNLNDMPLFAAADEGYAVANARDALKAVATGVIGENEQDGVAAYLAGVMRGR